MIDEVVWEGARRMLAEALQAKIDVNAARFADERVDEVTGKCKRFCSAIRPPWRRKTFKIAEVLPLPYLDGLSTGGPPPDVWTP